FDNQQELLDRMGIRSHNASEPDDWDLLAAAYDSWGTGCLDKMVGDFAFSLWDKGRQRLVCARDVFGVRSLFYYLDEKSFIWASRIHQLLALGRIPRSLETEY